MKSVRKYWAIVLAMVLSLVAMPAGAAIVAYDGTNVTFDPSDLVGPVITGIIAAIVAGVSIVIIMWGIRKVYAALKASR